MAISSKEEATAVAPEETTRDPIETKEALLYVAEVRESLMRDTSKSLHRVFIKNEQEQSANTPPENEEGEDELVLPQRGQVQNNFHHNAAPQSAYLTKWKPRHLFYLLYVGLLLISGVAGHGERGDPNDPLVINTRKRSVQEGDEYVVTEWPRTDDQQVFPFNILIGEDYECSKESFKDDSLSICTISLENSTNCGLSLKNFSEKYQLVYVRVINDVAYCIVQNAINNHTIMSGAVFVIPNKTLDPAPTCRALTTSTWVKQSGCDQDPPIGSVCEFSCPEGYIGHGDVNKTCQSNGTWSSTNFTCEVVTCPAPIVTGPLQTGCIPDSSGQTKVGSICTFPCPSDNQEGDVRKVCQPNGTWTTISSTCQAATYFDYRAAFYVALAPSIFFGLLFGIACFCLKREKDKNRKGQGAAEGTELQTREGYQGLSAESASPSEHFRTTARRTMDQHNVEAGR